MVDDQKVLFTYLSSMQDKLFKFYKEGKLTDVKWIVGPESEQVNAHSSICSMSNRLKELLSNSPTKENKYSIPIPPTLTTSAEELKSLLFLMYTGSLEEGRTVVDYIELCERFDVSIGHVICSRVLREIFIRSIIQPSLVVDQQKILQQLFIDAFEKTNSSEIQRTVLNMFRLHPLLFNTCLSKVPLDWFLKVLKEKLLWIQSIDGFILFGRSYVREVNKLLNNMCAVHGAELVPIDFNAKGSMLGKFESHDNKFITPTLAPICLNDLSSQQFGFHSYMHNYNYSVLSGNKSSFDKYPPNEWKVCAITGHICHSWDGRQLVAGLDITYQNLITGKKEVVLWGHGNDRQTIEVPEDDVITGVIVNSGWLIDKLVFTTLRGMHLDALGASDGGDRNVIGPSTFWRDVTWSEKDSVLVAFHGIQYINISSKGQTFINRLSFHFSSVDMKTIIKLNPNEKDFLNDILMKKILL